jgi:hypothetical protein
MRRALVVALVVVSLPGSAHAFVRRLNTMGKQVFWRESCVPVTIYLNGFERSAQAHGLDVAGIVKSVVAAAHAWSTDAVSCPAGGAPTLEIVPTLAPVDGASAAAGYDARNSIIFRKDSWPYADEALAHTSVWPGPDGHLVDVDIEVNASDPLKVWINLDEGVSPPPHSPQLSDGVQYYDLQAALTHEFGHFIGLMHTCYRPNEDGTRLKDDAGNDVAICDGTVENQASVMFPRIDAEQARQRTLSPDDVAGACAINDPAKPPGLCALDAAPAPSCAAAPVRPGTSTALAAAAALAGAAVLAARVRGRRRARLSARRRARS